MAHNPERKRIGTLDVAFSSTGDAPSPPFELPFNQLRDYRLLEPLGRGGMGSVYRALHMRLDKEVAIKIIATDRVRDPQAVARFEREMKAVGKLDHPNIVAAYDAGEVGEIHFLVMELVAGLTLSRLVENLGPLSIADACELACQVAAGLQFAQVAGLVHRDIKPSNLILSQTGQVKILDFGLAILRSDLQEPNLTATGQTLGTVDYISPEQVDGSSAVDIRADLYSLACTLFMLLTGSPPFANLSHPTPISRLVARKTELPPDVRDVRSDIPAALAAVLRRALSQSPEDRYQSPEAFQKALSEFTQGADLLNLVSQARASKVLPAISPIPETGAYLSSFAVSTSVNLPVPIEIGSSLQANTPCQSPRIVLARGRRHTAVCVGLGLLGLGWILFNVITLDTGWGILRIESLSEDMKVQVLRDGKEVELVDSQTGSTVRLKPGGYDVALRGSATNVRLDQGHVELTRDHVTLVRVTTIDDLPPVDRSAARETIVASQAIIPKAEEIGNFDNNKFRLLQNRVNELAKKPGGLNEAIETSKLFTEACRRQFGDNDEKVVAAELQLCQLYHLASKYDFEIPLLEHVVSIRTSLFGATDLKTLDAKWQLSLAYWGLGNIEQVAPIGQELRQEYQKQLGEDDLATIRAATLVGGALWRLDRPDEAVALLEPTAARRSRKQGATYAGTIETESILADAYMALGRFTKAQRIYESLLERAKQLPHQTGNVFYFTRGLAHAMELLGDHKRASSLLLDAVVAAQASQDAEKTLTTLALLATSLRHQNCLDVSTSRSLDLLTQCTAAKDRYGILAKQCGTQASVNLAILSRESAEAVTRRQLAETYLDELGQEITSTANRSGYRYHAMLSTRGHALSELGRFQEAISVFHVLRSSVPSNAEHWRFEALCLLSATRMDEYSALCQEMAARFANERDVDVVSSWAGASSLSRMDPQIAAAWLRDLPASISIELRIALHYSAHEYAKALEIAENDAARLADSPKSLLYLSLCHANLGQNDAANLRMNQVRELLNHSKSAYDWYELAVIRGLEARVMSLLK